jgi:hypothetical protein
MTQLALGFLDAIGQADLPRAMALAETAGDSLALVDDAIAVVADRLRTGQAPRQTVDAIRVLWELRWRIASTNVPPRAALPAMVAEIANVIAELEHPLRVIQGAEAASPADIEAFRAQLDRRPPPSTP